MTTFYTWRSKYGGMEVSDARKLKVLEDENRKLKKLLAESISVSSVLRFSPKVGFENSLVGISDSHSAGASPG
jgi:hypothetical protein